MASHGRCADYASAGDRIDADGTYKRTGPFCHEIDEDEAHIWHFHDRGRVSNSRHCGDTLAQQRAYDGVQRIEPGSATSTDR